MAQNDIDQPDDEQAQFLDAVNMLRAHNAAAIAPEQDDSSTPAAPPAAKPAVMGAETFGPPNPMEGETYGPWPTEKETYGPPSPKTQAQPAGNNLMQLMSRYNQARQPASNANPLSDIINKLITGDDSDLKAAQAHSDQTQFNTSLQRAANQVLGGVTHQRIDNSGLDAVDKQAQGGVNDVMAQRQALMERLKGAQTASTLKQQMEEQDPTSPTSQLARQLYEKAMHRPAPPNASAADLQKLDPYFTKMWNAEENAKNRANALAVAQKNKEAAQVTARQNQFDKQDDVYRMKFANDTMLGKLRNNTQLGTAANRVANSDQLLALIHSQKDPNNITNEQYAELVKGLDNMFSNGHGSVEGQRSLTASTGQATLAGALQYLSNVPTGAQRGSFIKNIEDTLNRERAVNKNNMDMSLTPLLKAYGNTSWARRNPEEFKQSLESIGRDAAYNMTQVPQVQGLQKVGDPSGDAVMMQAPDGSMRMVPKEKVNDAIKAGGKVVKTDG